METCNTEINIVWDIVKHNGQIACVLIEPTEVW